MPMLVQNTRASSKLKMDTNALDVPGSNQNGKHLLGPSPGSEDAHGNAVLYDLEKEAMMRDVSAEELGNEDEDGTLVKESESGLYETPHK